MKKITCFSFIFAGFLSTVTMGQIDLLSPSHIGSDIDAPYSSQKSLEKIMQSFRVQLDSTHDFDRLEMARHSQQVVRLAEEGRVEATKTIWDQFAPESPMRVLPTLPFRPVKLEPWITEPPMRIDSLSLSPGGHSCQPNKLAPPHLSNNLVVTNFATTCSMPGELDYKWTVKLALFGPRRTNGSRNKIESKFELIGNSVSFDTVFTEVKLPCENGWWESQVKLTRKRSGLFAKEHTVYHNSNYASISCSNP